MATFNDVDGVTITGTLAVTGAITASAGVTSAGGSQSATSATYGVSGSSGSTLTTTIDAINAGAGAGNTVLTADNAVKIGDAGNPTIDFPGTGAVTFTGNPTVNTGTGTLTAGGAAVVTGSLTIGADVVVSRQAANVAEFGSGDSVLIVGAAALGRRAASADANPTAAFTANGIELGAGGGTATDVTISRAAAGLLGLPTKLQIGAGVQIHTGSGAPSGTLSGALTTAVGLYIRTDGANGAEILYGTRDTGTTWLAVTFA